MIHEDMVRFTKISETLVRIDIRRVADAEWRFVKFHRIGDKK